MTQLTQTFYLSDETQKQARVLLENTQRFAQQFLHEHYWTDDHLQNYTENNPIKPYKYFTSLDTAPFETEPDYVYNRYKRCVFNKLGNIFEAHKDEYEAFKLVTSTVEENLIRRIGKRKIRNKLDDTSEYVTWDSITSVIDKLNSYYSTHGEFPDKYTSLVTTPEPNGTLSYSADDSQIHTLEYSQENQKLEFSFKHPSLTVSSVDSYHDWNTVRDAFDTFERFELVAGENASSIGKPTLREDHGDIMLDVPVEVGTVEPETVDERVISCDLGVKTQVTTTVLDHEHHKDHETDSHADCHSQVTTPEFVNHPNKDKLFRLIDEREHLLETRDQVLDRENATKQRKASIVEQVEQVKSRIQGLREQMQHDIANWLVLYAVEQNATTIAFENLSSLEAPSGMGSTSRTISSWARGKLLELVKYKAELVGVEVETVNPWGTSRHCPRCGERGETVKAPDNRERLRSGGWFVCERCGFEGDRDYVGALNTGRMVFSTEWKISLAKPVAYMETGKYASFSSLECGDRFASVRRDGVDSRDSDTSRVGLKSHHQSVNESGVIATRSRVACSSITRIVLNHTKN